MRHTTRFLMVSALVLFSAAIALADISVRISNQELTNSSDVIVIGRAGPSASRWIDRSLVTAVPVQVTESLKGGVIGQIEVLLPGGIDASRRIKVGMTYPGAPQIRANEEVFLFLTYDADVAGYVVSGFAQGKYSIITQQGQKVISRDLRGSQLVEGTGISRGTATLTPLQDFKDEIAGYLAR